MSLRKNTTNEIFCSWLINTFAPTSLVLSSPNAQKILGKNFLSPSQFMRPFGDLKDIPLKFIYSDKYQSTITNFKLDFYDPQDFDKKQVNQINNYIINCISTETIMPDFKQNFLIFERLNKIY